MWSTSIAKKMLGAAVAFGVLGILACGPGAQATPTPKATATPTSIPALPTIAAPTATPTSAPLPTGVVATATPTRIPTPTPVPADKPVYGGVMNKAESQVEILDTYHSRTGYGLSLGLVGNLFSQLVRVPVDTRTGVEGDLAESWKVSADGTEYTFKLRSGVVDHEGKPLTANDIYWGMVRYLERPNGVAARRQGCIRNYVKRIWDDKKQPVANGGAEMKSPTEIVIRLKGPRGAFIPCMTGGFVTFHAEKYVKAIDTDPSGQTRDLDPLKGELGGEYGPFKYKSWELNNFLTLVRNDKYFKPGLPYLDGINIYNIADENSRVAAYRTGRIDTICTWVCTSKPNVDTLVKDVPGTQVPSLVAIGLRSYQLNTRRAPFGPVGDPKADTLRRAIDLAIDREVVNKLAFDGIGFLSPPYYIGWPWIYTEAEWRKFPGWAKTENKAPEIAEAKKMMVSLGYGPNNRLKISNPSANSGQGLRENEALQTLLAEIYIDMDVVKLDDATRTARLEAYDFDVFSDSVGAPYVDPDSYNTDIFYEFKDGGRNRTGYLNPKFLELLNKETVLLTEAERAPILREMAKIIMNDAVMLGTIRPAVQQPNRGNWRGYNAPTLDGSNFSYEYLWLTK